MIPDADTWFFEKVEFLYPNFLSIKMIEGIKSAESELVHIDDETQLGPYFPVRVLPESRCLRVNFQEVISYHIISESCGSPIDKLDVIDEIGPVRKCDSLKYLEYVLSDSNLEQSNSREYSAYYIWTEDQTIFILSHSEPDLLVSDESPDLTLERYDTYFSK